MDKKLILSICATVALAGLGLHLLSAGPARAQTSTAIELKKPTCSTAAAPANGIGTNTVPSGYFVCVGDLDGTGTMEVIVGAALTGTSWRVTIINHDGTVRAAVTQ